MEVASGGHALAHVTVPQARRIVTVQTAVVGDAVPSHGPRVIVDVWFHKAIIFVLAVARGIGVTILITNICKQWGQEAYLSDPSPVSILRNSTRRKVMNKIAHRLHVVLMLTLLLLVGVVATSCALDRGMNPEALAKRLVEVQKHPFPPHSVGEIFVKAPLQQERMTVEIWSKGTNQIRMGFKDGEEAGDYNVTGDGKIMEYHKADNTYTVMEVEDAQESLPLGDLVDSVRKALERHNFKYDGVENIAGQKAYKVEIHADDNIAPGFDKLLISVDAQHGTLLGLKAEALGTSISWHAQKVDFSVPSDSLFSLSPPEGAQKVTPAWQSGIRLANLGEAEKYLGHKLLSPKWLPKGYKLVKIGTDGNKKNIAWLSYRKRALIGEKSLSISEIVVGSEISKRVSGPDNCKNKPVEVHDQAFVYSKCQVGSSLEWYHGNLLVTIEGFENEKTLLTIAESMK